MVFSEVCGGTLPLLWTLAFGGALDVALLDACLWCLWTLASGAVHCVSCRHHSSGAP
jgi:hypothetical protein